MPVWWWYCLGVGLLLAATALYGALVVAWRFRLQRVEVRPSLWPAELDGLTILQLSDLHCRRSSRVEDWLTQLAETVETPDLVVFTGDFCDGRAGLESCGAALARFRGRLGTFAILGNHDFYGPQQSTHVAKMLDGAGARLLRDEGLAVRNEGGEFWLAGVSYVRLDRGGQYEPGMAQALADRGDRPVLLLVHSPDAIIEAAEAGVALMISGHTHAGQICFPGGLPVINGLDRFPVTRHSRGVSQRDQTTLVVSPGLGATQPAIRLNCEPAALWITVRATGPDSGS